MQKLQLLFPDPLMRRLRAIAAMEGRPLSEMVCRAVERFVDQTPAAPVPISGPCKLPTFKGGRILADPRSMKQLLYANHE